MSLMHSLDTTNEYYASGGESIKKLSETVTQQCQKVPLDQSMVTTIVKEFDFALSVAATLPFDKNLHPLMRARVEYTLYGFSCIFDSDDEILSRDISEQCICGIFGLLKHVNTSIVDEAREQQQQQQSFIQSGLGLDSDLQSTASFATSKYMQDPNIEDSSVTYLFEDISQLMKGGSEDEYDRERGVSDTITATKKTRWGDMYSISLSVILSKVLHKYPHLSKKLKLSLADDILWCNSSLWQEQFVGFNLILASIESEDHAQTGTGQVGGPIAAAVLPPPPGSADKSATAKASTLSSSPSSSSSKPPGLTRQSSSTDRQGGKQAVVGNGFSSSSKDAPPLSRASSKLRPSKSTASTTGKPPMSKSESSREGKVGNDGRGNTPQRDSIDGSTAASKTVATRRRIGSSKRKSSSKDNSIAQIDELCKIGFVRTLVWTLLHRKRACRSMAVKILTVFLNLSADASILTSGDNSPINSSSTVSRSEFWPCLVEQGLISLLETITRGSTCAVVHVVPPDQSQGGNGSSGRVKDPLLFPEGFVRGLACQLLIQVVDYCEKFENIRTRLCSAMIHSGNTKLRINIFSGLVYLSQRSNHLGRMFWCASNILGVAGGTASASVPPGKGGSISLLDSEFSPPPITISAHNNGLVFMDVLSSLVKEPQEFRTFLRILLHFLGTAEELRNILISRKPVLNLASVRTTDFSNLVLHIASARTGITGSSLMDKLFPEPKLLIRENGKVTKMTLPSVSTIAAHSIHVAQLIENSLLRQLTEAIARIQMTSANADHPLFGESMSPCRNGPIDLYKQLGDIEQLLPPVLASLQQEELYVPLIDGSYYIWQELFSHIAADSFLLDVSLGQISLPDLFEVFRLSCQYRMRVLHNRYTSELSKRMNSTTFCHILQASVGYAQLSAPGASQASSLSARHDVYNPGVSMLNLPLTMRCLEYLSVNMERVLTPKKPQDVGEITRLLHHILAHLFKL